MLLVKERVLHFNKYRKTPIYLLALYYRNQNQTHQNQTACSLMEVHTVKSDNTGVRPFLPPQWKGSTLPVESLSHDLLTPNTCNQEPRHYFGINNYFLKPCCGHNKPYTFLGRRWGRTTLFLKPNWRMCLSTTTLCSEKEVKDIIVMYQTNSQVTV